MDNATELPAWRDTPQERPRTTPRLHLERLTRRFGDVEALRDVSFSVASGEIVPWWGSRAVGSRRFCASSPVWTGRTRAGSPLTARRLPVLPIFVEPEQRRIGFVFQDYALFPHLDVYGEHSVRPEDPVKAGSKSPLGETIVTRLGIWHLSDRYPHMLSGGEQQRVALARALAPRATHSPDGRAFLQPRPQAAGCRARGDAGHFFGSCKTTVIMVTHDPEEALVRRRPRGAAAFRETSSR